MSDLQRRTEQLLREKGYLTASVEKRKRFPARGKPKCRVCGAVPMIDIASDLFGVFDLIAVRPMVSWLEGDARVLVQVTSRANHATRRNKILASAEAKLCYRAGFQILIQSWRKVDNRWQPHDEWISLDQFVKGLPDTVEQFYIDQARLALLDRKKKLPPLPPGSTLPLAVDFEDLPF